MKKAVKAVLIAIMTFCFGVTAHAAILYDIDFSTPHTVGNVPVVNGDTNTPSKINFGDPRVETNLGALNDQPLVFNVAGNVNYDQISLNLGGGYNYYSVEFDFSAENYVNSGSSSIFTLFLDTPQIRDLQFKPNGNINWFVPGGYNSTIGSFENNELCHLAIKVDLLDEHIAIFLNDSLLYGGAFFPSGNDINRLRYSFGKLGYCMGHDSVAIDNILVTGSQVPIPGAIWLLGSGLIGLIGIRRKTTK